MVISYEMIMSVRFFLTYDPSKWDFIPYKMNIISVKNALLAQILSMEVMCVRAKVLFQVWS